MIPTITNRYGSARTSHLKGRSTSVFKASSWDDAYSHHPQIASLNGKLLATWSLGHLHEDGPGQKMVFATSGDLGQTWTEPATLIPATSGEFAETCVTSGGLHVCGDSLTAYFSSYEITPSGFAKFMESGVNQWDTPGMKPVQNVYTGIVVSPDGGQTWQDSGSRIPGFITNLSPVAIASGRLVMSGHRLHAYTDDPAGIQGWQITPLPGLPDGFYERACGICPVAGTLKQLGICEGSVYEIPGAPLRMMLRSNKARLAVSESHDNGASWGEPELTDFTDCGSKMQFGRLPDGRYYALSCPDPNVPESCLRRTPLVLAVSMDGNIFDRHFVLGDESDRLLRYPGAYKHGRYGYPYAHFRGDHLYIINSVGKEDVECHWFDLKDLSE